ncbi:MAG: GTPase Era [Lentisphaerota bacterium]
MSEATPQPDLPQRKSAMIAIVGRANVGKSTLINEILQEKVSIVSPVAQTTRNMVRGILNEPRGQLVFLDTPGVHRSSYELGHIMNRKARAAVDGVDIVMLVLDRSHAPGQEDEGWMKRLAETAQPVVAVLNKSDRETHHDDEYKNLWQQLASAREPATPIHWMTASGLKGEGVPQLVDRLFELSTMGPRLFPEDILTDFPRKWTFSDIIREKLFLNLHDELPHSVAVFIESIEEAGDDWNVEATIYVDKPSQKPIILGAKGRLLRKVRRAAETELRTMYAKNISLTMWVKVEKNWTKNFWMLKKLGYME